MNWIDLIKPRKTIVLDQAQAGRTPNFVPGEDETPPVFQRRPLDMKTAEENISAEAAPLDEEPKRRNISELFDPSFLGNEQKNESSIGNGNFESDIINAQRRYDELKNQKVVNQDRGWKGRLKDIGREALIGASQIASAGGNVGQIAGGAIAGGLGGGFKPTMNEERDKQKKLGEIQEDITQKQKIADWLEKSKRAAVDRENITVDNNARQQQIDDQRQYRKDTLDDKEKNRQAQRLNVQTRTIASMINKLPELNLSDPRYASIAAAAKEIGLPITEKDSKKKVQMIQDAETGAWTLTLTDPFSGAQEVRSVTNKNGEQLVTTSGQKVMANAAMTRQDDQQQFTSEEKAKDRAAKFKELEIATQKWYADFLQKQANQGTKDPKSTDPKSTELAGKIIQVKTALANKKISQAEHDQLMKILGQ